MGFIKGFCKACIISMSGKILFFCPHGPLFSHFSPQLNMMSMDLDGYDYISVGHGYLAY